MTLSARAFDYIRDLVHREAAIVLGPGKEYLVETRLIPLARASGQATVDDYVGRLQSRGNVCDREAVVEALTTNETSWFRDREPFEALTSHVLPALLENPSPRRRLTIWSAACSSGQEAYTLAMVMAEHVVPLGWSVDIVASDISEQMLQRTREGRYSQLEVNRGLPAAMMVKHFHKVGTSWQVSDQLRSMVRVQRFNLAAPFPPLPTFDIVFMRNVLIYFDNDTKRSILQRTRQVLSPQGFLVLGGAESTLGIDDRWERIPAGRCTLNRPVTGGNHVSARRLPAPLVSAGEGR